MKIAGKVFFVLSLLALPLMMGMYALDLFVLNGQIASGGWRGLMIYAIIGIVLYIIFGAVSHILIGRGRNDDKDCKGLYYGTYPPFILGFVVILLAGLIIKFVKFLITAITGKEFSSSSRGGKGGTVYTVIDGGFERTLGFLESKQDVDSDSPFFTKYYNRFRDDVGNYWRSYDNNETFMKESAGQVSRGY